MHYGPKIITNGLIFAYDTGDISTSYLGEPTTNKMRRISDVSTNGYAPINEYSTPVISRSYNASIQTPIGYGATLLTETGSSGFHALSWFGTGGGLTNSESLSAYVYPITDNINNLTIGMLGSATRTTFSLISASYGNTGSYSNNGTSNSFITRVQNYPGWYRLGTNYIGRGGGWVGSFGISTNATYTSSIPYKSFYVAGFQDELKPHVTPFVSGSRSSTQGLLNLINNNNTLTLSSMSFDVNAIPYFSSASSNYMPINGTLNIGNVFTIISVINVSGSGGLVDVSIIGSDANGADNWFGIFSSKLYVHYTELADVNNRSLQGSTTLTTGRYYHVAITVSSSATSSVGLYLNGNIETSASSLFPIGSWTGTGVTMGRRGTVSQRYFDGYIPMTNIYNRILSNTEILQHYNNIKTRFR